MRILNIKSEVAARLDFNFFEKIARLVFKIAKTESRQADLIFVSRNKIRELNRQYRGVDRVTDVLSFPWEEKKSLYLGEIFICYDVARRQAKGYGHPFKKEMAILLIHGLLHLLGYDHRRVKNRIKMERLEKKIHPYVST